MEIASPNSDPTLRLVLRKAIDLLKL